MLSLIMVEVMWRVTAVAEGRLRFPLRNSREGKR